MKRSRRSISRLSAGVRQLVRAKMIGRAGTNVPTLLYSYPTCAAEPVRAAGVAGKRHERVSQCLLVADGYDVPIYSILDYLPHAADIRRDNG
jgi:hypothetical protein